MRKQKDKLYEGKASSGSKRLEGKYANYIEIGHNAFEFILDFGQHYPENEEAELCTRIITSPNYAKAFLNALMASIENFEERFGDIEEPE